MHDGFIYGKTTSGAYRGLQVDDTGSIQATTEYLPSLLSDATVIYNGTGVVDDGSNNLTAWNNTGTNQAVGDMTSVSLATTDTWNGVLPIVRFPGSVTQRCQTPASVIIPRPCTVCIVWGQTSYTGNGNWDYLIDSCVGDPVARFLARAWGVGRDLRGFSGADWLDGAVQAADDQPRAAMFILNAASNRAVYESPALDTGYSATGNNERLHAMGLGNFRHADGTSATAGLHGWVGEVYVVPRVPTEPEIANTLSYFGIKWRG